MRKTSKSFRLIIAIAAAGVMIGALEVFDLHPQLSVGNFHSYWVGVKKANLGASGTMIIPLTNGQTEIYKDYNFALFTVVHIELI